MEKFNLENQYQQYLKRVGLDENKMHPVQKKETKRAFFGACGQMLVLLRDDVSELEDDKAIETLENMDNQVNSFWVNEAVSKN